MEQNLSLIKSNPQLLEALHKGLHVDNLLSRELLALKCTVAGTSYWDALKVQPKLVADLKFELRREPKNEHDKFPIALYFEESKIGYIPRRKNETIARLMDGGKGFFAKVEEAEMEGNMLNIEVSVFLKD